ncbi:hypothetical protein G6M87_19710 [Rhizobium rhizogenes]|uniref:hypothetical protein n=1 Tax=Rhizobium TaxID=379 RepID=UPI0005875E13|nr:MULTISPECIES: hypothetical protein [Rhizobium]NTI24095.1 hypothetical protein [Rhizobium rhizogenes]QTG07577.1 hypothetical protein G6M87_19710 [Rhizobium rhizogenes]
MSKLDFKIKFDYPDDDLTIHELKTKGFRDDVVVLINEKELKFHFYNPIRLKQEIDTWIEKKNYIFIIDGILLLQDDLGNEAIRARLHQLHDDGYFE